MNVSASSTLAGFTVEGPAKGDVTINSSPFTITLGNGTINGIIRITPSASNNDGTFTPASVSLTNSTRTATFTYKPLKWGKRTLSFSNDRGLANPTSMEFVGMAQIGKSDNYSFSGRPGPSLRGFDVLNYGDWKTFKQSVRNVPVDQYSDRYIERLAGLSVYPGFSAPRATGGYGYGAGYNIVRGDTPRVPIDYLEYVSESESEPMPFAPDLQIEDHPSNSALPPAQKNGGDQHTHVYVRNEETGGIKEVIECQTIWSETLGQSWKANSCSTWDIDALDAGGPGVTQATATPVIVGGKVKSITVTNGGSGYPVAPQVFIRKGNRGIGAHAKATIENGRVTSIQVLSEGANYDPGTRVFFGGLRPEGDTSSDAAGLPNTPLAVHYDEVASGDVGHAMRFTLAAWRTPVAITATIAVPGGRVTGMTVTSPGTGLIYPPTVTFSGGGGAGAAATATISNGKVTGFIITNGGGASSSSSSSISSSSSSRGRVATSSSASISEPVHLAPLASPLCSTLSQTSVPQEKGLLSLMLEGRKVTFDDVPASAWFTLPMFSLIQDNVMSGYRYSAGVLIGKMQPERLVSFEEMAKMILLSSGRSINAVNGDATNLSAQKSWSNKYVRLAEDTNLSLYTKNVIVTSASSRGAAVRTILEALGIPRQSAATSPFKDLDTKNPFYQDILTAVNYGIITGDIDASGKSTGKVRPTDPLKRAELATIILRAVKVMCQ